MREKFKVSCIPHVRDIAAIKTLRISPISSSHCFDDLNVLVNTDNEPRHHFWYVRCQNILLTFQYRIHIHCFAQSSETFRSASQIHLTHVQVFGCRREGKMGGPC